MSKNLEQRVNDVLAIALERDNPGFSIEHEPSWQRRMKGALAQVFFLGMGVGWDKCIASMDNKFRDLSPRDQAQP